MLGLGYPGGAALERLAADGDPRAFAFPGSPGERARGGRGARARRSREGLDFSFAGLKTALLYRCASCSEGERDGACGRPRRLLPGGDRRGLVERAERALERTGMRPPGARRRRGGQRRAAPRGSASSASSVHVPAARAVHRQRGDDRERGALRRAACPIPTTSGSTPTRPARRALERAWMRRTPSSRSTPSPTATSATRRSQALRALQARARLRAARARHHRRRARCTAPTSSGSRWSSSTARSCANTSSTEALVRERLESRR